MIESTLILAATFGSVLSMIGNILLILFGVSMVIFVHELGHYLAGRWAGVGIEKFSLGFGPRLLGFKRGETDYCISAIPLGGFVKFSGEEVTESNVENPRDFQNAPVYKRAVIAVAGVTMNVIFALICYTVALTFGYKVISPELGYVNPDSIAGKAGLEMNDRIQTVNGSKVLEFEEFLQEIALSDAGDLITITGLRRGESFTTTVVPREATSGMLKGLSTIGLSPLGMAKLPDPNGSAAKTDFRSGDLLVKVNDFEIEDLAKTARELAKIKSGEVVMTVRRQIDGQAIEVKLDPLYHYTLGLTFKDENTVTVGSVREDSPAEKAGLKKDDIILKVDGKTFPEFSLMSEYIGGRDGKEVVLEIRRDDKIETIKATPKEDEEAKRALLGFSPGMGKSLNVIETVQPGSPAETAGIKPGEKIVTVYDLKEARYDEQFDAPIFEPVKLAYLVDGAQGKTISLGVEDTDGNLRRIDIEGVRAGSGTILVLGAYKAMKTEMTPGMTFFQAVPAAYHRSVFAVRQIGMLISKLVNRPKSTGHAIGGPIMIAQVSYGYLKRGFTSLIKFLGFIGINLAVLNLLPIPVLDGGMLVMLGVEGAMRRKPPEKIVIIAQTIGFVFLVSLMLFVFYNDIMRLLGF